MMDSRDLASAYRGYIACLNARDWDRLGCFVGEDVWHNGRQIGLCGYRAMLERDVAEIPDLRFDIDMMTVEASQIAARLWFDCTPRGSFLGLAVNGRKIRFAEHAFYAFRAGRIERVWSVLDKAAVEAQLGIEP
jgi:predicted ester cyclase